MRGPGVHFIPLLIFLIGIRPFFLSAQDQGTTERMDSLTFLPSVFQGGDTVLQLEMDPISVTACHKGKSKAYQKQYERLKPKVIKVYPYAQVAALLLDHYQKKMDSMGSEARKKLYMKKVEEDLKAEFKDEITDLTITEGRILMKLIDRETGHTSFRIIERLRGRMAAHFWQGVASIFGHDLRSEYDPVDDERVIEAIVLDIRSGKLQVPRREPNSEKVEELLRAGSDIGHWWRLES